ncbi:MAG: lysylphosphatidylglycerol synthase domain-containing protein [Salibacteraceae bacterium]
MVSWTLKILLSGLAVYYIAVEIWSERLQFLSALTILKEQSALYTLSLLLVCMILLIFNWGLEMVKWHMLLGRVFETRWQTAVKGVLTGTTVGVFTPNRMGEFIGRVLALRPEHRIVGALLSFLNGIAQSIATMSYGLLALFLLVERLGDDAIGEVGVAVLRVLFVLLWMLTITLYFQLPRIATRIQGIKILSKWKDQLIGLQGVQTPILNQLFLLSLLRFATFIGQYFIVFSFLIQEPNLLLIGGLATITLFSNTALSFLPVPDIILRQAVAISYFSLFDFNLTSVSLAVFLVWLINVALPALSGAMILLSYRIFRSA